MCIYYFPVVPPTQKPVLGLSPPTPPVGLHPGLSPTTPVGFSPPAPPHKLPQLNKCTPNPCQNSGTCIPIGTVDFACKCPPQFTGKLCAEAAKSYCHPSPCLNGGICTQSPAGYKCQCVGHYRGTNCQGTSRFMYIFIYICMPIFLFVYLCCQLYER